MYLINVVILVKRENIDRKVYFIFLVFQRKTFIGREKIKVKLKVLEEGPCLNKGK